jgi:hypothetical protein
LISLTSLPRFEITTDNMGDPWAGFLGVVTAIQKPPHEWNFEGMKEGFTGTCNATGVNNGMKEGFSGFIDNIQKPPHEWDQRGAAAGFVGTCAAVGELSGLQVLHQLKHG